MYYNKIIIDIDIIKIKKLNELCGFTNFIFFSNQKYFIVVVQCA